MTEATKTMTYEAMFLAGQAAAADLGGLVEHINEILGRAGVELLAMQKWDERRLAYEIDKQKRGCYILAYFAGEPGSTVKIERDVRISDRLMRVLVTRADHLTDEEIAAADARDALMSEAKLRAERGSEEEEKSSGVRLGAPEQANAEDDAPAGDDDAETKAEEPAATEG